MKLRHSVIFANVFAVFETCHSRKNLEFKLFKKVHLKTSRFLAIREGMNRVNRKGENRSCSWFRDPHCHNGEQLLKKY